MYLSTALALAGSAGIAAAHPFHLSSRNVVAFPAGSSWDIVLSGAGDALDNMNSIEGETFGAIDVDLFDTDQAAIAELKASKQVICYFSAGSQEDWRPDAGDITDVGKNLDGWPGEKWVDVKSENVRNVMKKRIVMAAEKGCTAIDPDNVDGFDGNQDGFGYDKAAYADYVKFMAQEAQNNGLAIGLKNALDLIPEVLDVVQFAVNEQCHEYDECARYMPFTEANKAVFNIEYGGNSCESPSGVKLSTLIKPEDQGLNTLGGACQGQTEEPSEPEPKPEPESESSQPTPSASASATPAPTSTSKPADPTPIVEEEEEDDDDDENEEPAPPSPTRRPWKHSYPSWRKHQRGH